MTRNARLARTRGTLGCVFAVLLTSCTTLLTRDDYAAYRPPPKDVRSIEAVALDALSRSEPTSVEDAAGSPAETVVVQEVAESMDLSIADVRAAALANNLDLKVALVDPSILREDVTEAEAEFEPLLFGSIRQDKIDQPSTIVDGTGTQATATSYDMGVQIPLRTGGTVSVSLPFGKTDDRTLRESADSDLDFINPTYQSALKFTFSQPLLRDAGIRTNTHAIRVAKYSRDIADARTKLEAIRILANADQAYWLLYAARGEHRIRQEQHEKAQQQLEQAKLRVAAGDAPEIEIMRAESGVARRLEAIIVAETEVRRRERDLKRVMNRDGLSMSSPTSLLPVTEPNPIGLDLDAEALAENAVANRMEMLEIELQLAIDASKVDFERNATLPLLTLDYSYTINALAGSFNDAFRGVGRGSFADSSIGLTAQIPLGNKAARSRLRRTMFERVQRLATRNQRRLAIRQEVFDALDQLQQSWQRILAARREVDLAERTFRAEKRQFDVGLRTSTEVLEADARLGDAQSRRIRALAAYEMAQIDIAYATGTLLGKDRVIWESAEID
ncbi:MAG: TolC family protein [Phycisphaerae bacterium]